MRCEMISGVGWMKAVRAWSGIALGCVSLLLGGGSLCGEVLYENDFDAEPLDFEPEGFLVLDGDFTVQKAASDGANQVLRLPGTPLENFGALFGKNRAEGSRIQGRVLSQGRRRLAPAFGLGVNGLGGYRLMVSANKRLVELLQGDRVVAEAPFRWKSGEWCQLVLEAAPVEGAGWRVRGKAWALAESEPGDWLVIHESESAPPRGKPSLWGHPFAGNAIEYDKLLVEALPAFSAEEPSGPTLGLQTWTVRNYDFEEAVAFVLKHGFRKLALSRVHMDPRAPMAETRAKKAVLDQHGLEAYTFGVARTSLDHYDNRRLFEFARFMGIGLIVVEPDDFKVFESLERLVREYDIRVAIHNHGIRTLYGNPLVVRNVIRHLDERIGVCLDTGWVTAAGFDPGAVYREYEGRVFDIHLKDKRTVKTQGDDVFFDTHIGEGEAGLSDFLKLLVQDGYSGVLALETDSPEFARQPDGFAGRAVTYFGRILGE